VHYEIIVVDDNSPDGTDQAIEEIAAQDRHIRLLKRQGKLGLGSAVLDGVRASQGEYIIMMDADLSHQPEDLKKLIDAAESSNIVIGSRYVDGGEIKGWTLRRKIVSKGAVLLSRWLLTLPMKDTTSGFALFRRKLLEELDEKLDPKGFKFLLEILVKSPQAKVTEVPITFINRLKGRSKFGFNEVVDFIRLCYNLRTKKS
jgi:dolichol-phosphate mannosyltransferase